MYFEDRVLIWKLRGEFGFCWICSSLLTQNIVSTFESKLHVMFHSTSVTNLGLQCQTVKLRQMVEISKLPFPFFGPSRE